MSRFLLVSALLSFGPFVELCQSAERVLIPPGLDDLPAPAWQRGEAGADVLSAGEVTADSRVLLSGEPSGSPVKYLFPGRLVPTTSGNGVITAIAVDLDRDGILDLACVEKPEDRSRLAIRYGRSDGTFGLPDRTYSLTNATWLAAGRFNADALPDLVVLENPGQQRMTLFLAQAGGGYTASVSYPTDGKFVITGDFDADGVSDVATAGGSWAYVRRGMGNGTLGAAQAAHQTSSNGWYRSLDVGDVNGDNIDDLVGVSYSPKCLWIMHGRSSLGLDTAIERPITNYVENVSIGDYNGDGRKDVAIRDPSHGISVFYAQTDGTLGTRQDYTVSASLSDHAAAGDIDGDGRDDLVVLENYGYYGLRPRTFHGRQGGGFRAAAAPPLYNIATNLRGLSIADVDRDGQAEALLMSYPLGELAIWDYHRLHNQLILRSDIEVLPYGGRTGISVGDFDADGAPDLALTDTTRKEVRVLWGDAKSGAFSIDEAVYPVPAAPWRIAVADLDRDGLLDLAVSTTTGLLRILHQVAPRAFNAPADYAVGTGAAGVVAQDFNQDGRLDLAAGGKVLFGQADGTFGGAVAIGVNGEIVAGDFDGDGWVDVAGRFGDRGLGVVYNQAGSGFTEAQGVQLSQAPSTLAAGDFNGDGWLDLAAWHGSGDTQSVAVLYGQEAGGFTGPPSILGPFSQVSSAPAIAAADFNRDGFDDLCVGCSRTTLLLGSETNPLQEAQHYAALTVWSTLATADVNVDGRPDIVGLASKYVSILLNQDNSPARGDLTAVSISGPPAGLAGEVVDVTWMVRNNRASPLTARWTDGIYLSHDQTWDINDRLLGKLEYNDTLAGNTTYTRNAAVALPGVLAGPHYILLRTDIYQDIREDEGEYDNVAAAAISIDVPELTLGQARADAFEVDRQGKLYKVNVLADKDLLVTFAPDAEGTAYELYLRYGLPPTRTVFDAQYEGKWGNRTSRIPGTKAGTYYVLAYVDKLPTTGSGDFTVTPEYLPLTLTDWGPKRGGNTGQVTVDFVGTGFHPGVQATLILPDSQVIAPTQSLFSNAGRFTATFNLDGQPVTPCTLRLHNPDGSELLLESAFTIEQGVDFSVSGLFLSAPRQIRPGQPARYEVAIGNAGNTDIPYLLVDISYPAEYVDNDPAIWIELTYPQLDDPPPIEGIDWSQVSPTVVVDGRVHLPILMRNFPVNRPILSWGGGGFIPVDLAFTIRHSARVPVSGWNVRVSLMPMSEAMMRESLYFEAELIRRSLLADPPRDPFVAQLRADAALWDFIAPQLADSLSWREYYYANYLEILDPHSALHTIGSVVRPALTNTSAGRHNATAKFVTSSMVFGTLFGPYHPAVIIPATWLFLHEVGDHFDLPEEYHTCVDYALWVSTLGPFCGPGTWYLMSGSTSIVTSRDPNDKLRHAGWGPEGFVAAERLPYTVRFENLPAASAAALKVDIIDQLSSNLDWSTLQLDEIGFAGTVIKVPEGLDHYEGRVELDGWTWDEINGWHRYEADGVTPNIPLVVDIEAGIDPDTGVIRWTIACADPATGFWPEDIFAGFLPPNQESIFYPDPADATRTIHPGEGYVSYSVRPVADLPTGTQIKNKASIVFDWNEAIDTPEVLNTIDAVAPTSSVNPLPTIQDSNPVVQLAWTGQDDPGGSGVASYTILVSTDGGGYVPAIQNSSETTGSFTGEYGHTYAFYSVATDNVGHVEAPPTDGGGQIVPDATITLVDTIPPVLSTAVSRKSHGSAGDFDVVLRAPGAMPEGIECRKDGPTKVILAFSEDVKAADGMLDETEVALSAGTLGSVTISGSELAVNLSGVPDMTCLTISLSGITDLAGNPLGGANTVNIRVLLGDTNGSGSVSVADVNQTRSLSGQTAEGANFRSDTNCSGSISVADVNQVRSRSGNSVTCP